MTTPFFSRTELLLGTQPMQRLAATKVIIFGVGGVGSWCAEALVRSGVVHLTLVDPDLVDPSNVNRQLPALTSTLGRPKVEVLRERFLDINPQAEIVARCERFTADTAPAFHIEQFDYVIDAIDSIADKLELILLCTQKNNSPLRGNHENPANGFEKISQDLCGPDKSLKSENNLQDFQDFAGGGSFKPVLFSSMGAARKLDPLQVRVTEFWKVDGCPLAATLRKRMRKQLRFPGRKFKCVWSPERNDNANPKGTMMPVTATFGLTLASLIIKNATL